MDNIHTHTAPYTYTYIHIQFHTYTTHIHIQFHTYVHTYTYNTYRRTLFKCVVKCLRFRGKREIASLFFAFARGFTWFARGSLFYCVVLNAIVEKNSQFAIIRLSHLKSVLRYIHTHTAPYLHTYTYIHVHTHTYSSILTHIYIHTHTAECRVLPAGYKACHITHYSGYSMK